MPSSPTTGFRRRACRLLALAPACLVLLAAAGAGGGPPPRENGAGDRQIRVTADGFQAHTRERVAEFFGNVKAVQGGFEIASDRLKIYYEAEDGGDPAPLAMGKAVIRQIVASGNVRILADGRHARAHEAIYAMETRELVLIGPDATLSSEKNHISGSRITFNRRTGQVRIESGDRERVSGAFYPGKRREPAREEAEAPGVIFLTPPEPSASAPETARPGREPPPR